MTDAPSTEPEVSVIIPTCNRRDLMLRCLEGLARQTHERFETIVIDDASTDDTPAMLERFARDHPRIDLRVLRNEVNIGANPSRNRGIAQARGRLVAFLDSDCIAEPSWMTRLVAAFGDDDRVAALTGLVRDPPPRNIYELAFRGTHRIHRRGAAHRLIGGNMCVRRDVLLKLMLDEDLLPPRAGASAVPDTTVSAGCDEEGLFLMMRAADLRIMAEPDAIVVHEHGYTRRSFFKQAFRGGWSAARLVYKYRLWPRLDMLPFMLGYATLPLGLWRWWLLGVPAFFLAAAVVAVTFNELCRKGKTLGETVRSLPVLLAYYHVRLIGYVSEAIRLRVARHAIERVDLPEAARRLRPNPS